MAYTDQLQESKDFREADGFEILHLKNLASPIKSPQRRRPGNLYNTVPPFSTSPLIKRRVEDTSFRCPKSCSPNSDKMCDGVGTLSTASSDGVESSRRASSISGCNTPLLSHTGEERQDRQSCTVSDCNTPGWSGSACSDIEEDIEPGSPGIQEFVSKSKFQRRKQRCARVVSALAESADYKLYGYKNLRAAFEALDRDGDGRLSINELKTLLNEVGLSDKAVVQFFESLKGIHGDTIDYSQFLATYAPAIGGGGCHGRMWPRNYRAFRCVPSVEGDRWCMY